MKKLKWRGGGGGGGGGWLSDYQISEKGCLNEFSCYFAMFLIDDT
jgi:hypothetical protein